MQHYVPRFYLQNFAIDPDLDSPQVYCFDKPNQNHFPVSTTNIAGENYFYDLPEDEEQEFEHGLANIEGEFSRAYDDLLSHRDLDSLDENDRSAIAYSVAVQELRTRETREKHREVISGLRQVLEEENLSEELEEEMEELRQADSEEGANRMQIELIIERGWEFAEHVLALKWVLIENETGHPFWTSDHPIVRYNSNDSGPYGNLGLRNRGIQIYFPLSPTVSLGFVDPDSFANCPRHLVIQDDEDGHEHIKLQNGLQMQFSTRHVISNSNDFSMAHDFLDQFPEYADTNRQRVDIS
ncbi:DUF4238 domain-containing protein [Haloarchaeobius sp. HME9146]|uniref:DUF4238 domain-containing protein n=1 Tax=Haloarchaeobius sp. HME9146 TaxID=2978732 RepID=UPI0021C10461|nr:DUF4238 domain-containing protein [Haloarchaeobius sp. HME9146]MCT9097914.1 DUF4238 domain-containing protein [Haloarchaeobius sp. HME9146]